MYVFSSKSFKYAQAHDVARNKPKSYLFYEMNSPFAYNMKWAAELVIFRERGKLFLPATWNERASKLNAHTRKSCLLHTGARATAKVRQESDDY